MNSTIEKLIDDILGFKDIDKELLTILAKSAYRQGESDAMDKARQIISN